MAANISRVDELQQSAARFASLFNNFYEEAMESPLLDANEQDELKSTFEQWNSAVEKGNQQALLDVEDNDHLGRLPAIDRKHSLKFGMQDTLDTLSDLPNLLTSESFTRLDSEQIEGLLTSLQQLKTLTAETLGAQNKRGV